MDHFLYKNGVLHAEDVPIPEITTKVETPFYCYSTATLVRHYHLFTQALSPLPHLVCFAVKSLSNLAVLKLLGNLGAGMDVVSGGEYSRAKAAGIPGERVVFSGVGKTRTEMQLALKGGIRQFNVESEPELYTLSEVANSLGLRAPVSLRINPDVDAKTHEKISTGKFDTKFGIPIGRASAIYAEAAHLPGIDVIGIDMHIGSQLTDLTPFETAFTLMRDLVEKLRFEGHSIKKLDLGGGLGIPYTRSDQAPLLPLDYGNMIKRILGNTGCEIDIEPGRLISGNAGIMVSSAIYVKKGENRDFLILDAAMNDLMRPAIYGASHDIIPVKEKSAGAAQHIYDVVGPVCETGDIFAKQYMFPSGISSGNLVAFRSAGAYGAVMASEYNTRPLVPEVMVSDHHFDIIRARPEIDDILSRDKIPSWL